MPIGNRLKDARILADMTQEELAKAVGVTKGAIGNYESGVSSPKEVILIRLMEVLQVDANYLYQDFMNIPRMGEDESRLLTAYRAAEPPIRDAALTMLENSAAKNKEKAGHTAKRAEVS